MRAFLLNVGFILSLLGLSLHAQTPAPSAKFTFDNRNAKDLIDSIRPKLVGVNFCDDRFGNKNHAVHIFGNEFSYINLGNAAALKPKQGSISLWVSIEREVYTGKGYDVNPIIITKNSKKDEFFEAYGMYYLIETNRLNASCARDSLRQAVVTSAKTYDLYSWHHLVITYDRDYFCFYVDGKLERKTEKQFETNFLENDSVMVGVSANKKNNRYMEGAVDDIEFYDAVLSPDQVKELYQAPNPNKASIITRNVSIAALVILFLFAFYKLIQYRIEVRDRKEKMLLEMRNIVLETDLKVNRALMNPHFVFNSLNTLQNFILKNEMQSANKYLVKFSRLLRKILESNLSGQIALEFEVSLLREYIEVECLRFEEDIKYSITVDPSINGGLTQIPIMMIQPFVENAIWHGLLNKEGEKLLSITFRQIEGDYIECSIDDNGTGRIMQETNKSRKNSMATVFVLQRLDLLSKLNGLECTLEIIDKPNKSGTTVLIKLPILKQR